MITTIIILIIIILIVLSIRINESKADVETKWFLILTIGVVIGVMINIGVIINKDDPRLDVYRGKTELKINGYYQNGEFITTDSIVIYK